MSAPRGVIQYPAGYEQPIASAARYLLDTIIATYDAAGVSYPTRHVITIGSVAVDDAVIAVMFGGVAVGPPGNQMDTPYRGDAPRSLTFNVELWRETPSIGPSGHAPSAASVSAAAEVTMRDAWLLLEAAYASDQMGVGVIANVTVNPPQGQMVGVSLACEMQVP